MKKKETYVSQFEFLEEVEREERQLEYCRQCGKQTVSLHKGICFQCRAKAGGHNTQEIDVLEEVQQKRKNIWLDMYSVFSIIIVVLSVMMAIGRISRESILYYTTSNAAVWQLISSVAVAIFTIAVQRDFVRRFKTAYITNFILLGVLIIHSLIFEGLAFAVIRIIWSIPNIIYFTKRKHLFVN